jgi:molybdenum cofactor cytidylyltransferase
MSTLKSDPVAIVLAAGSSQRMGMDKLFAKLGPKRVIERTLLTFRNAKHVPDVLLVIPPDSKQKWAPLRSPTLHLIENPDPSRGMISSIRAGLESGWAQEQNFFLCPGDVPFIKPEVVDKMVQTFVTRGCKIVLPSYHGLGGHPGLFSAGLSGDFFLSGDESGAREILMRHARDTVRMHVQDPDVCFDIDSPDDLSLALDADARREQVEAKVAAKRKHRLQ